MTKTFACAIYAVDIGSIAKKNFAWARIEVNDKNHSPDSYISGNSVKSFVDNLTSDCKNGPVSLGFECPLFFTIPSSDENLLGTNDGTGRFDENRSCFAGAGATSGFLAIQQIIFIFQQIKKIESKYIEELTTDEDEWMLKNRKFLVWEAFVSGGAKCRCKQLILPNCPEPHAHDALTAAVEFFRDWQDGFKKNQKTVEQNTDERLLYSTIRVALDVVTQGQADINQTRRKPVVIEPDAPVKITEYKK